MEREYDVFEILPDGGPLWPCAVHRHQNAIAKLEEVASQTENEVRVMYMPSNAVIAAVNVPKP